MIGRAVAIALIVAVGCPAAAGPSSYSRGEGGARALYAFVADLGYDTRRIFDPYRLSDSDAALILFDDIGAKTAGRKLASWVERGGELVLAPVGFGGDRCKAVHVGGAFTIARARRSGREKQTVTAMGTKLSFRSPGCVFKGPITGWSVVVPAKKKGDALVVERRLGEGRILALSDGEWLTNAYLDGDNIAVLLRRWLERHVNAGAGADGGAGADTETSARVAFLETTNSDGLLGLLFGPRLAPVMLHALVLLLLVYWALTPRFGDPHPAVATGRRSFADHARALGRLYRQAGASAHVLQRQYERFVARFDGGSPMSIAGLVATRTGRDATAVAELLADVEAAISAARPKGRTRRAAAVAYHLQLSRALAALSHGREQAAASGVRETTQHQRIER